jgi:hypothetical protein
MSTQQKENTEGKTREHILDMMVASEKAAPPPNFGYGSVNYRQVRAACRYAGPIDAVLGQLQKEGIIDSWMPGSTIYICFERLADVRPDVLKEGQAEEIAKLRAEGVLGGEKAEET